MATYQFSALANLQHLGFNAAVDSIAFDQPATALIIEADGNTVRLVLGTKTVFLDDLALESLRTAAFTFPSGSTWRYGDGSASGRADWYGTSLTFSGPTVSVHVAGLGGADTVTTSAGNDVLVGNGPLVQLAQVSTASGVGSPNASSDVSISADGRFVAFYGGWTGFGSQSNSGTDVFVKDMLTGTVVNEHKSASGDFGLSGSGAPEISADGRWLVFWSASALVTGAPGATIFMAATAGPGISAVSTTAGGAFADGPSDNPDVSADGRWVVFESRATNLAAGGNASYDDIFVKDTVAGTVWRASTSLAGGDANADCRDPKISADGRYVVFSSYATNLTPTDGSTHADLYLWDRSTQKLVNVTGGKGGDFDVLDADIAADGSTGGVVVFETGKALVADDTNNAVDVYAWRIADGSFTRVSTRADGAQVALGGRDPAVSGDGRFVVFTSGSEELVAGDSNGWDDVFVKDLQTGAIALVSRPIGGQANQHSGYADISLGGDWVVFESGASNLAPGNANGGLNDVFRVSNPLLVDTLRGGAGDDTYVVQRPDVIVEGVNAGNDTVRSGISWTLGATLENLTLSGSSAVNGTGNAQANLITGNGAANVLNGGAGNDTLVGGGGNDSLVGGTGDDRLDGGLGSDTMVGGEGSDTYVCDAPSDIVSETGTVAGAVDTVISAVNWTLGATLENLTLSGSSAVNGTGNAQANLITGNGAANVLNGGAGNDTLVGGGGNDSLVGGTGDDRLDGGLGSDTMVGGEGSDTYVCDASGDIVSETGTVAGAVDTVISAVNWTLGATLENLTLSGSLAVNGTGNAQANLITGNGAANLLRGGAGDDTLVGGGGNDTLEGQAGSDRLTGGSGADFFRLSSRVGSDTITDFTSGADKLQVSMAMAAVGDGDLVVEGALVRGAPGGFGTGAELVVFTANAAALTPSAAAAAIGAATSAYAVGAKVLFAVDDGTSSALFLFTAANANAAVEAGELSLLATLQGSAATALADYAFVA